METYFRIPYQFDKAVVWERIDWMVEGNVPGYICVADGVTVSTVQHSEGMRTILGEASLVVCDSGWIPLFIRWIYGHKYEQYAGTDFFRDGISKRKYRMMFLGTSRKTLDPLQENLAKIDARIQDMPFSELPFCTVDEFDYQGIATHVNLYHPDIIWVSLGMPKQEQFMYRLKPHITQGVMIGVGAAFKFLSGMKNQKRAPKWMIRCKIEWIHRLFSEPKKQIKRCWLILHTFPTMLYQELKQKRRQHVL